MEPMASLQGIKINLAGGSLGVCELRGVGWGKPVSCPWWLRLLDVRAPAVLARRTLPLPTRGPQHPPALACQRPSPSELRTRLDAFVCTTLGRDLTEAEFLRWMEKTSESKLWVSHQLLPKGVFPRQAGNILRAFRSVCRSTSLPPFPILKFYSLNREKQVD